MKLIADSIPMCCVKTAVALTALFILIVPNAQAKHGSTNSTEQQATVIAHIPLAGAPATQMLLQEQDGRDYLYLVRNSRKGFTVVDVTKPAHPSLVKRVAWPDGASAGRLQLVGNSLGIAEGADARGVSARGGTAPETVELLDLSDPANPRTVKSFSGVTSMLADEGRRLIYVTNGEGLWIVKSRPQKFVMQACSTEDAMSPMPSCQ